MADIFLSYAREDRAVAEKLADALVKRGWSVWWDRRIRVGRSFARDIERELDAARCVVVVWSAASVGSEWVLNEAAEGQQRGVLIPVRIEARVRIPLEFRRLHTAELVGWPDVDGEFNECVAAIASFVAPNAPSAAEEPAAEPPEPRRPRIDGEDTTSSALVHSDDPPAESAQTVRLGGTRQQWDSTRQALYATGRVVMIEAAHVRGGWDVTITLRGRLNRAVVYKIARENGMVVLPR